MIPPRYKIGKQLRDYGCGSMPWNLFGGIGSIELGEWYNCEGRDCVPFSGVCNGVMACCNWNEDGVARYGLDGGLIVDAKSKITLEYVILNRETVGEAESIVQEGFGQRGDLGSLLFDRHGQTCGLYYGNAMLWVGPGAVGGLKMNAGLVTSMTDLKRGIEKRLGGEVSLCLLRDDTCAPKARAWLDPSQFL